MRHIVLRKTFFTDKESEFVSLEGLTASLFRFETGVEAIRVQNDLGHIVVLPFKGQMIREAVFGGRTLNMSRENKIIPKKNGNFFLEDAYGSFYFHCGALRMGSPAADDDHPLHGELPYADYDEAELVVGNDEKGHFIGITGRFTYNRGFGPCYEAWPLIRMYAGASLLEISIRIDNLSNYPMGLMYMAHTNFRLVENARIVQSNAWTPEAMPLCDYGPTHFAAADGYVETCARLKRDPGLTKVIEPGIPYDPEACFYLEAPVTDSDGWAHVMQVLPDGTADFIKYKPSELRYAMRWISITKDQRAVGLAFPSTSKNEGYKSEKRNDRVQILAPKSSFETAILVGYLDREAAEKEERFIDMCGPDQGSRARF
jgi:hypothetical protein